MGALPGMKRGQLGKQIEQLLEAVINGRTARVSAEVPFRVRLRMPMALIAAGARVVAFGGGTGLSTVVGGNSQLDDWPDNPFIGLKEAFPCLDVVVCTTDDGGSTGLLLQQHPIIGIGDLRKLLLSLISRMSCRPPTASATEKTRQLVASSTASSTTVFPQPGTISESFPGHSGRAGRLAAILSRTPCPAVGFAGRISCPARGRANHEAWRPLPGKCFRVLPIEATIYSRQRLRVAQVMHHDPRKFALAVRALVFAHQQFNLKGEAFSGPGSPQPSPDCELAHPPVLCAYRKTVNRALAAKRFSPPELEPVFQEIVWENRDIRVDHFKFFRGARIVPAVQWDRSNEWDNVLGYYDPEDGMLRIHEQLRHERERLKGNL